MNEWAQFRSTSTNGYCGNESNHSSGDSCDRIVGRSTVRCEGNWEEQEAENNRLQNVIKVRDLKRQYRDLQQECKMVQKQVSKMERERKELVRKREILKRRQRKREIGMQKCRKGRELCRSCSPVSIVYGFVASVLIYFLWTTQLHNRS